VTTLSAPSKLGILIPWVGPEAWMLSSFLAIDLLVYGLSLVSAGRARWSEPGINRPKPVPLQVKARERALARKRRN